MSEAVPNAAPTNPADKLDFKKVFPIFVVVLIDILGLTIIIPLLPLYAASFGADASVIGMLGATYPVMQFIGAPLLGRLSDRYGRRPILVVSQIGTFIGFLLLGFANTLPLLFLSRIIDGLSGANIATAQAMIADSTTEKTRTQGMGLIGAAFGLGFIVGPVIAFLALAISGNNYHTPAFVAAAFSAISIALSWFWLKETRQPDAHASNGRGAKSALSFGAMLKAVTHPQVGILLILMFAQQIAFGGFEQFLSLFTLNRLGLNASGNALVFVFIGVIVVAIQGKFIGDWSRKWGDRRLIYLGLATLAIGLALSALTPAQPVPWYSKAGLEAELNKPRTTLNETPTTQNMPIPLPDDSNRGWAGLVWLLVAMVPASIGGGILQPSINSLITKRIEPYERGGTLGISTAFSSAANAVAPVFGGLLFALAGASAPFWVWAAIMAVLLFIAVRAIKPDPVRHSSSAAQPTTAS